MGNCVQEPRSIKALTKQIYITNKKMKKLFTTVLLASALCFTQTAQAKVNHLLPKPQTVQIQEGKAFALNRNVTISDPTNSTLLAKFFTDNGCAITDNGATVMVNLVSSIDGAYDYNLYGYDNEAYTLDITADAINITAITSTGVIRAAQTLAQLAEGYEGAAELEALTLTDWPAFKLRGYMHDVGRSFIEFETLKKHIDLLSRFKVNTFHWHMTENQAWRFEVKEYPQLTQASSMTRFAGKYYTQAQCRALQDYAKERGVIVIPEIDMPGHSEAFKRAMGHSMQTDEGVAELQKILEEVVATFPDAPYIHIGADEETITYPDFLKIMTNKIHNLGKKVVVWNPIRGVTISTSTGADMTQMWSSSGKVIDGMPNIDCRYNYTNHFDVFADLIGIYKSNIYYTDKGNTNVAGTISAPWNDRKTPTEEDIIIQNNFYANVIASAERAWIGGGKLYIEKGGTTLPNSGEEYDEFADWERRFLFHKANSLKNEPIAYVKQTNVRWHITEPFPNNGNMNATFAPESDGLSANAEMKESYEHNGATYSTGMATGAGIYLRHTWGNNTVPTYYGSTNHDNKTAYAWTYVYSDKEQTVGAQIEFQNYGRSEKDTAPDAGKWDRKGSDIWLNGERIAPPVWDNTGVGINNEKDLMNENFTARKPVQVTLKQGWNKVFIKLPYVGASGVRLNKWMFTFVLTDLDGKNAIDGLIYSPNKCMDVAADLLAATISEAKKYVASVTGEEPGKFNPELATELNNVIATIEATYGNTMSEEERANQQKVLNDALDSFKASLATATQNMPKTSDATKSYFYTLSTPQRENRYPTSNGADTEMTGNTSVTDASIWKFVARNDGKLDIVNYADGTYVSPASNNNTALRTQATSPTNGWELKPASTQGLFIIVSGSAQFNQTNNSTLGYKVYNWGSGSNTTDTGCQYLISPADVEEKEPEIIELPDAVLTLTDNVLNGTQPYKLTDKEADKVFKLESFTIALDVTMNGTINGRGAFVCAADPAQDVAQNAIKNATPYFAFGHNGAKLAHLASSRSGDVFTAKNTTLQANTNVKVVFTVNRTAAGTGALVSFTNGVKDNENNYPLVEYTLPVFSEMKANQPNANIYIGGGMAANNPIELCDGTIHSVQFFDRVLTGEQIASIKYTNLTSTCIKEFEATESKENTIFDLQGRRLEKITQGGIYIVNGNKIIVK